MYFLVYLAILLALLHILTQQKILSTLHYVLLIATLCALSLKIYKHLKAPKVS
ncbi:hypothetical protein HCMG_01065 [Helicobacter canadensis MIT 98-5491]|nr:hypothetical protein HCMG_01065 [Helicobacter canadensis MIT 98-5491]